MRILGLCIVLLSVAALGHANALQNTIDVKRLQGILQEGVKSKDISTLYHSLKGLKLLKANIPDVCETIKSYKYDVNNLEEIFYLTNAAALSGCVNYLKPDVLGTPNRVLDKKDVTIPELYQAVFSLKALGKGQTMDKDEALKNLIQLLKKDDSPANYAHVFALCEHIGCEAWTAAHGEGVLQAADETDGRLHFEGGLPVTSMLVSALLRSYKTLKKPSPLTAEQRTKLAEYLVSRRALAAPRGAALLLEAALELADDEPSPICIALKRGGRKYVTPDSDSVEVTVSDLLGRPVKGEVLAQSGTRLSDDVVVLSKQQLTPKSGDATTYILNLSKIKTQYGVYKIVLSVGGVTSSITVPVLGEYRVASLEVGVGDADGVSSPKVTAVAYPNKLPHVLHADHLQNVQIKFSVVAGGRAARVQQAFVRVASPADEAIFVAEPDAAGLYKVDLSVKQLSKHVSGAGDYSLTLLVGDAAAAAPVAWTFADARFSFADNTAIGEPSKPASRPRGPLPEISHQFRSAEARPPRLVSDVCAALCAAPLLLLLILWAKLRVNLGNMPLVPSALLFHLSLGGSLALYAVLWLRLSMFETVRYLLPLGLLTFLSGHRLLRCLVATKR